MQKKIKKIILASMIAFPGTISLSGCSSSSSTSSLDPSQTSDDTTTSVDIQETISQLAVVPEKCIGCGKCIRIDPEHFIMEGRKATVLNQENTRSQMVQKAIQGCPTDAIVL